MEIAGKVPTDVAAGCCTDIYTHVFSRIESQEEMVKKWGLCWSFWHHQEMGFGYLEVLENATGVGSFRVRGFTFSLFSDSQLQMFLSAFASQVNLLFFISWSDAKCLASKTVGPYFLYFLYLVSESYFSKKLVCHSSL